MPIPLLTLQYGPEGVPEITLDGDGVALLVDLLSKLRVGDHEHLSTESWGGRELTEDFPHPDLAPIYQMTISRVDDSAGSG